MVYVFELKRKGIERKQKSRQRENKARAISGGEPNIN